MTPLVGMMPCMDYLTNITVLTPPGECCDGFKSIVSDAPICLCHGMNGDMNQFMPKPIDPIRMTILPLACGTVLPIQTLFMCSSKLQLSHVYIYFHRFRSCKEINELVFIVYLVDSTISAAAHASYPCRAAGDA